MIIEYLVPESVEEALTYLQRKSPLTRAMGGGTIVNRPSKEDFAVVDLQKLALDGVEETGEDWMLGATLSLQHLLEYPGIPEALNKAIRHEASYNIRQVATVAGRLVAGDGRSPFLCAMLALDAELILNDAVFKLEEYLARRDTSLKGKLILRVKIPQQSKFNYEYVARTPADLPIVAIAASLLSADQMRLVAGGSGQQPVLIYDGVVSEEAVLKAIEDKFSSMADAWASAEYRLDVAKTLTGRAFKALTA